VARAGVTGPGRPARPLQRPTVRRRPSSALRLRHPARPVQRRVPDRDRLRQALDLARRLAPARRRRLVRPLRRPLRSRLPPRWLRRFRNLLYRRSRLRSSVRPLPSSRRPRWPAMLLWCRRADRPPSPAPVPRGSATTRSVSVPVLRRRARRHCAPRRPVRVAAEVASSRPVPVARVTVRPARPVLAVRPDPVALGRTRA
jgi:hypothetical protein